jgi:hypothetical protein
VSDDLGYGIEYIDEKIKAIDADIVRYQDDDKRLAGDGLVDEHPLRQQAQRRERAAKLARHRWTETKRKYEEDGIE